MLFILNSSFIIAAIEKTLSQKLEDARSAVQLRVVKALREYRNLYSVQHRLANRMIYPESLKFLMLYGLALCRSTALRGGYGDVPLDERCAAGHIMMTVSIKRLLKLLYPSLIRLDEYLLKVYVAYLKKIPIIWLNCQMHELLIPPVFQASVQADDLKSVERRLPLTGESLDSRGLYIYDDGFRFIIWFGRVISPDIAKNLLGADFAAELSKVLYILAIQKQVHNRYFSRQRVYYRLSH